MRKDTHITTQKRHYISSSIRTWTLCTIQTSSVDEIGLLFFVYNEPINIREEFLVFVIQSNA